MTDFFSLFEAVVKLLGDERSRYHQRQRYEREKAVIDARNSFFPFFARDKIARVEQELEAWKRSFVSEVKGKVESSL